MRKESVFSGGSLRDQRFVVMIDISSHYSRYFFRQYHEIIRASPRLCFVTDVIGIPYIVHVLIHCGPL